MKKISNLWLVVVLLLATATAFSQGNTRSSINGTILDENNEPLGGANIQAIHTPSGTSYGSVTDFDGHYRIPNMRVGGPYKITISYVGYENYEKTTVHLQLGQTLNISYQMKSNASQLDEVVIVGNRNSLFDGNKTGSETTITERQIKSLPSASRSIADYVRLTPQASITEGNDGFSISFAGNNNRFNAIYVDGAVSNDVFGLAGSGTNGGQTGVSPFSVDAIEQFQVQVAPFDVRIGGFSGGAVNAITRSGTNEFKGSAYYFMRNESLAGKTPVDLVPSGDSREKLNDFTAKTYGFRIGGPIVKDKVFFFLNYERQDDVTPQPFNVGNYLGDSGSADLTAITNFLQTNYNYNPGVYDQNDFTLESDKVTLKFDFNLGENHKISLKHNYTKAVNLESRNSNNRFIGFLNGSEFFTSVTNTTAFELNSSFGSKYANSLILGYTRVRDDRDPSGDPFPTVVIRDGSGTIQFGAEPFSTANLLDTDVFTLTDNFEIFKGRHTITLGTHNEYSKVKNLFFAFNYGQYQYDNLGDFFSGNIDRFIRGYSLVADGAGDTSSGAAELKVFQLGFYAQDEVQVNDNFKFTAGIRFDLPIWEDGPVNDDFNNNAIPLLQGAGKDLQGARVGRAVANTLHVSPRVGFNWNVKGENKTQIRGGFGIFTSRLPLVWPGGTYNNNGVTGGFLFQDADFGHTIAPFNPDVNSQPVGAVPGTGQNGGNIDLFASNFKLPQVMKYNLAFDHKLPWAGLTLSGDFLYQKTITNIYYENLNVKGPVGHLTGTGDNRPIYNRGDEITSTYDRIILASNTNEGETYNLVGTLSKSFKNGFQGSVSYSYGEAYAIFDGTSSQNSSQWRGIENVNGKNSDLPLSRSNFSAGSRVISNMSYEKKWSDNMKSTFGLVYTGRQGSPYSYTYGGRASRLQNDDSRDFTALMYVPASAADIHLTTNNWAELDAFLSSDDYLSTRRGQYAERNASRGPWTHVVDFKFLHDFMYKNNTLQLSFDIFNFTNLINKDWGVMDFRPRQAQFLNFEGFEADGTTPTFSFDPADAENLDQIDDSGLQSSRWQMQVGLRYIFN
jgi:outer membrane receptor for ferrienterochelin and colicin